MVPIFDTQLNQYVEHEHPENLTSNDLVPISEELANLRGIVTQIPQLIPKDNISEKELATFKTEIYSILSSVIKSINGLSDNVHRMNGKSKEISTSLFSKVNFDAGDFNNNYYDTVLDGGNFGENADYVINLNNGF